MESPASELLHATTIAIDGRAVMLLGPSGAGKSDLALRLIDRGAALVSDDYTLVAPGREGPCAEAPATIAGQIEVRGLGILRVDAAAATPVALVVHLATGTERMPEPATCALAGCRVAEVTLDPHEASAPIKVELALRRALETAG